MKATSILTPILLFFLAGYTTARASTLNNTKTDTTEIKTDIDKVGKNYSHAYATGDSLLMFNCYADGAIILPPNAPAMKGKAGILAVFKAGYSGGMRSIAFKTVGLFGLTDQYVTEQGTYEAFDANNAVLDKGKFLVVWTKTIDGWKMYRDMFSSSISRSRPAK
jgi:ketosteroid isomerase-like protein